VLLVFEKGTSIDPEDIIERVEKEMAPFMENCCAEPDKMYMKFYDEEDEYLKEYEKGGREMVVMPDGRLLLPWDEEFRVKPKKGEFPFTTPKAPPELPRREVPFKETYSTFEEFVKEWHGGAERDETYNRYGYWQNGPKYLIDLCLGNEEQILQGLPEGKTRKVLLSGEKTKLSGGWDYNLPILPVQTMRSEISPGSPAWDAQKMALEREVWDYLERIQATPANTKRIMSDLFSPVEGKAKSGSGPQSSDRGSSFPALQSLQYTLSDGSRQYRAVDCGSKLPHAAHITCSENIGCAKWDWYEIGGRWAGFFQLKPNRKGIKGSQYNFTGELSGSSGGKADICLKNAVDFEAMRKEVEEGAAKAYDAVWEAIKDTPTSEPWEMILADFRGKDIEEGRRKYHAQPRVKAFREFSGSKEGRDMVGFFTNVEEFHIPREQYLQNARNGASVPFAVIKNGKWHERGTMGWWGAVRDEKDPETWDSMVAQLMDDLPEEALLVVCDCHI
jgi:hypothetical protein